MKFPIYLDNASTTPLDKKVLNKMLKYLTSDGEFGNAASRSHIFGWKAEEAVDKARNQISKLISADSREIIFTSGATESNNLAIKGCAYFYKNKGNHIITSQTEHKSVLDSCRYLETQGFDVTYIKPESNGIIDLIKIEEAIKKNTILVSIMHINNETGIMQNIKKIGSICKSRNIFFHVDATQSIGKIKININDINVNLMSFSSHKIHGPKGIGGLYIRRRPRIRLVSQIHGGGHEKGMRSGTLPVHQIVGMGYAFSIANKNMISSQRKIKKLRDFLWEGIKDIEEIYLNSDLLNGSPNILNVSFNYVEGESLIMALKDIAISSGSACTSASLEPSYVLSAVGVKDELAHSSIRFSLSKFNTLEEIKYTINIIHKSINKLREISPLWEMFKSGVDLDNIKWDHK
ncbi:IscS subfamily cysteine desulfurase [Buchnera aphidicola (Neophyllaphis varicolor)]|uniref:IscS subfamily cysteine desulfurase n=1 Tax=Buchnera aphidicola TaxID=9 RepID=UPI0031B80AB4